jgi:hypothetical protein
MDLTRFAPSGDRFGRFDHRPSEVHGCGRQFPHHYEIDDQLLLILAWRAEGIATSFPSPGAPVGLPER